ncbi:glycosyl transferase [Beggiatoa alba B18LD]|uniref:Glycosyl transferase n=1 Tax=Beggiatoa alba B18LD TaxID=395493 RepID=I3CC36_9GAMM|nr:glycosyltransferase [Beggiatoa alba]EIJ41179.1 glycosyl transferase [Beggiatoa alba B18LD]
MPFSRLLSLFRPKQPEPAPVVPLVDKPTAIDLKRWASSEWIEYQAWLFHYSFLSLEEWQQQRDESCTWENPLKISLVTPVYNTPPDFLRECIYSVQTQSYPYWELCLVDDGSSSADSLHCLQALTEHDTRIKVHYAPQNLGICPATNQAIAMATGDYVAFLDHDDRLAPDALYWVAKTLREMPETDIVYTDRDMISPTGFRFMHLFKPQWSPETLLSGNYLFHLMVYRRTLLNELGGVRPEFEGSQDYDLILRARDKGVKVQHIARVLYHWRQHQHSVALAHNAKEYAYQAGIRALQESLARQQVVNAQVTENKALWRGNYQITFAPVPAEHYQILTLPVDVDYVNCLNQAVENAPTEVAYFVILADDLQPLDDTAIQALLGWLQLSAVGMVTGKVLNGEKQILHAGWVQRPNGLPLALYQHHPETAPNYMAMTAIAHNVSIPHPFCCAIKRETVRALTGLTMDYHSPYALFDFALRALQAGWRTVYTPFARFQSVEYWQEPCDWSATDRQQFCEQWATWLQQGDPYYNPFLTTDLVDMGLTMYWQLAQPAGWAVEMLAPKTLVPEHT